MKTECIVTTFCDNGRGSQRVMNLFKNDSVYFISVDEVVGEPFAYKIVSRVIEYIIHAETDRTARAFYHEKLDKVYPEYVKTITTIN